MASQKSHAGIGISNPGQTVIHSLPIELLFKITGHLSLTGIPALMLTCKSIYNNLIVDFQKIQRRRVLTPAEKIEENARIMEALHKSNMDIYPCHSCGKMHRYSRQNTKNSASKECLISAGFIEPIPPLPESRHHLPDPTKNLTGKDSTKLLFDDIHHLMKMHRDTTTKDQYISESVQLILKQLGEKMMRKRRPSKSPYPYNDCLVRQDIEVGLKIVGDRLLLRIESECVIDLDKYDSLTQIPAQDGTNCLHRNPEERREMETNFLHLVSLLIAEGRCPHGKIGGLVIDILRKAAKKYPASNDIVSKTGSRYDYGDNIIDRQIRVCRCCPTVIHLSARPWNIRERRISVDVYAVRDLGPGICHLEAPWACQVVRPYSTFLKVDYHANDTAPDLFRAWKYASTLAPKFTIRKLYMSTPSRGLGGLEWKDGSQYWNMQKHTKDISNIHYKFMLIYKRYLISEQPLHWTVDPIDPWCGIKADSLGEVDAFLLKASQERLKTIKARAAALEKERYELSESKRKKQEVWKPYISPINQDEDMMDIDNPDYPPTHSEKDEQMLDAYTHENEQILGAYAHEDKAFDLPDSELYQNHYPNATYFTDPKNLRGIPVYPDKQPIILDLEDDDIPSLEPVPAPGLGMGPGATPDDESDDEYNSEDDDTPDWEENLAPGVLGGPGTPPGAGYDLDGELSYPVGYDGWGAPETSPPVLSGLVQYTSVDWETPPPVEHDEDGIAYSEDLSGQGGFDLQVNYSGYVSGSDHGDIEFLNLN